MNVMGVQYAGNNLPEANTRNLRVSVKRQEEQGNQLQWLQEIYETYVRHLRQFEKKLQNPVNNNNLELIELRIDCLKKINEIQQKINALTVK